MAVSPVLLRRSTVTAAPPAGLQYGEASFLVTATDTKAWFKDNAGVNRLLLSTNPADNPVALSRAGGTLTGPLTGGASTWNGNALFNANVTLSADPTIPLEAATKRYVDATIAVGDTPPATPRDNTLWYDSVVGQMYFRYNDGTSTQWVKV